MLDIVVEESSRYGVRLSEGQIDQLQLYHDTLVRTSAVVNLVGNTASDVIQRRHILESIAFGSALREREILKPDARVADVGAGAGFPGLVIRIVWPRTALTLIEATEKKAAFLAEVIDALGLEGTVARTGRAEDLGHDPGLRGQFDLVVARALAPLPVLLELTLPFARVGGHVATPKGSRAHDEVASAAHALDELGARAFTMQLAVPGPKQTLVVIRKDRPTPVEYPRKPGRPAKNPL